MSDDASTSQPAPHPEAIRAFYDRFTDDRSQAYARQKNPRIGKALARILSLVREDSKVLEIGCGAGLIAEQIARAAPRGFVWACDISETAIALARSQVNAANVQFRALDVGTEFEELTTWLSGPVDLAVAVDVLEHLPISEHCKFFQNLTTILQPGSAAVLTFPSPDYQRHLREHDPRELQIIDEIIELPHLYLVTAQNGFTIKHFSLEDVWLLNQYVHCILMRTIRDYPVGDKTGAALEEIANLVQLGEKFILVDQDEWPAKAPPGREAIPFLERGGVYWGPPPDDTAAIRECERLRLAGARYIVFAWPAFWWLDHYARFHQHLDTLPCLLKNDRLVVFKLTN